MANVRQETVLRWIADHPELTFDAATNHIFCAKCNLSFKSKKNIFEKHIISKLHSGRRAPEPEEFYLDFIQFLILCNIPWAQVNNPGLKYFFEKYFCLLKCCTCSNKSLPDESLLRKVYLDKLYNSKINAIYDKTKNEKLWISLDETTDFLGRNVMHFLVRPLSENVANKSRLIACKILERVNGQTVSQFVIDCLETL